MVQGDITYGTPSQCLHVCAATYHSLLFSMCQRFHTFPNPPQSLKAILSRLSNSTSSHRSGSHSFSPHVDAYGRRPSSPLQKLMDSGLSAVWCSSRMDGAGNPSGGTELAPVQKTRTSSRLMRRVPSETVQ